MTRGLLNSAEEMFILYAQLQPAIQAWVPVKIEHYGVVILADDLPQMFSQVRLLGKVG